MINTDEKDPTEEEIDAAQKLRGEGRFAEALAATQQLLDRAKDQSTRMWLLFDILYCSTQLGDVRVTDEAVRELDTMPEPQFSRVLANSIRADAETDLGRPENALAILDMNLETGYFEREDFRVPKYGLYFSKGKALERLGRWEEALDWLDKAHLMFPDEASCPDDATRRAFSWTEIEILFNKSRCMYGLDKFQEAYELAEKAHERAQGDTKTLALMYMANCRFMNGNFADALRLYLDIQKQLPCRAIATERLREGINRCLKELEARGEKRMPS
jgi:tetratricopeptide (TPR) repeat protein